jgi:hypothetical protein
MEKNELTELMTTAAQDAVLFAQQQYQLTLDYSADSVGLVDQLLDELAVKHRQKPLQDAEVFTLCNIFGAYLGQIFLQTVGGDWFYQQANEQAPFVTLNYGNHEYPFASVVYHKLVVNTEVRLKEYLRLAISNSTQ